MAARGYAGNYLSVASLINVLPSDYIIIAKENENELYKGIVWVARQSGWVMEKLARYDVISFETNFNNDECTVKAGYRVAR